MLLLCRLCSKTQNSGYKSLRFRSTFFNDVSYGGSISTISICCFHNKKQKSGYKSHQFWCFLFSYDIKHLSYTHKERNAKILGTNHSNLSSYFLISWFCD